MTAGGTLLHRLLAQLGWWDALRARGTERLLAMNSFVDAAGTGLAAICLPFYALLVADLSPGRFAAVLSAGGVAELLLTVPAGALAGRIGVFRYSVLTRVGRAAGYAAFAFCESFWALLVLSIAIGALRAGGGGLNQSLTAAAVGEVRRSETLAVTRALRNIGYLVSGGAAALLLAGQSPVLLRLALVVNAVSFLLSAWFVSRVRPLSAARPPKEQPDWSVLRDVSYLVLVVVATVFASSIMILDVALPLWVLKHDSVPPAVIGVIAMANTFMVVLWQFRFSQRAKTVPDSLRGLRLAALCFGAMALALAFGGESHWIIATAVALLAGLLLTIGEMSESPAWWTLSYELAPEDRTDEYLATFDLSWALLNIAGPPLMVLVVSSGWMGWLAYAALIFLALGVAQLIATHRIASKAVEQTT